MIPIRFVPVEDGDAGRFRRAVASARDAVAAELGEDGSVGRARGSGFTVRADIDDEGRITEAIARGVAAAFSEMGMVVSPSGSLVPDDSEAVEVG